MWNKRNLQETAKTPSGVDVTLTELIALRGHDAHQHRQRKKKWLAAPGQRLTVMRGRGIEFDATREYQSGDDIRSMAWRVTARSLKPHVKVYQEERERPVWLAVDLSPSLYFGTRTMFKSVRSIKQAAELGWSYLMQRERIGAVIAGQQKVQVFKPRADEGNFLTILNALADYSKKRPAFSEANYLCHLLQTLQQQARSGNLVFILSDFFHFDAHSQKLILSIAQRAQVVLMFVYDPFEAEPPPPHAYLVTDGQKRALFNMGDARSRQLYQQQFQLKLDNLINFSRKYHISLQLLRTNQREE